MKRRVLVVDDESSIRSMLSTFLRSKGYEIAEAESSRDAQELVTTFHPDVALVDYALPDATALDLLRRLKDLQPGIPVVILTGHASIELAVRAIKQGAQNFVAKPVHLASLALTLEKAIEEKDHEALAPANPASNLEIPDPFVGSSSLIAELAEQAHKVAHSESPVLIQGATGTGKGVLARWLHANSPRAAEPFVDLNCAGLSREFLETELFGHERGAFTGAVTAKSGLFEIADRGTIFLDEIGDMPLHMQAKLLRVLEEGEIERIGGDKPIAVNVRVLVATHRDLDARVREEKFRQDLFHRIYVYPLVLPPLRDRAEDIPALVEHFAAQVCSQNGWKPVPFSGEAMQALQSYSWPGNVRELRNMVERLMLLASDGQVNLETVQSALPRNNNSALNAASSGILADRVQSFEREVILAELKRSQNNVTLAAKTLGLERSHLYKKAEQLGIDMRALRREHGGTE